MRLNISGLRELREHLERLRPEEVMARALGEQAERMAARVRDGLSEPSGSAGHDEPWLQSGALRDSVSARADGLRAVVGSSHPAAAPQELGTAHMPARPFLAPVAASMGEEVARAVGATVAATLRGDSTDAFDPSGTRLVSESGKHPQGLEDVSPQDRRVVEEGLETPGQARAHGLPQIIPGLSSPVPTIPLLGGGRGSATPNNKPASTPIGRSGNPIEVAPGTNQPTMIDGRLYSGHALDRMQGRGIPLSAVEEAIQNGRKSPGNTPGTTVHTGDNGVIAVAGLDGQVITVITR